MSGMDDQAIRCILFPKTGSNSHCENSRANNRTLIHNPEEDEIPDATRISGYTTAIV